MSEPFLGEIRVFSFNFPPKGWAFCDGQLLPINQNQALFSILGTTYGGDGRQTFALPNLKGRIPVHTGSVNTLGTVGGEESHTLTLGELPTHSHAASAYGASTGASQSAPAGHVWAYNGSVNQFSATADSTMAAASIASVGGGQAHQNMPPILVLNFCIALQGIFPSQN